MIMDSPIVAHTLSGAISFLLASIGFFLMASGYVGYGYTLFICTPISIGIALGDKASWKTGVLYSGVLGLIAFLLLLLFSNTEGIICIFLLSPVVVTGMIGGIIIGKGINEWIFPKDESKIRSFVIPALIILLSAGIEHQVSTKGSLDYVSSAILLPYTPEEVFFALERIDTLDAEKSWLFSLGLPIPEKCVLDSAAIGAYRTCYFRDGYIKQEMTQYSPGEILKMDIVENTLPGRPWITFKDALYEFEAAAEGTRLVRHTSYHSTLHPRIYWRWAENLGIQSEHEYVFRDLERRLGEKLEK